MPCRNSRKRENGQECAEKREKYFFLSQYSLPPKKEGLVMHFLSTRKFSRMRLYRHCRCCQIQHPQHLHLGPLVVPFSQILFLQLPGLDLLFRFLVVSTFHKSTSS